MSEPVLGRRATQRGLTLKEDYAVAPLSEVDPEMDWVLGRERKNNTRLF